MSTALQLRRRSQLLGIPVFVEGTVERLGFLSQVWVDRHTLRVVGWSIRLDGSPESGVAVPLSASKLLGTGALLLHSDALSAPLKTETYVRLIPQVLETQSGVSLGRIKDFTFDMASGAIASVRTSGTGIPLLPRALDSTFEIARTDLIANDSLKAEEGAEERLTLLKRGLLEQAGIGKFDWALPLSAGEAPEPDEKTLEAIAQLAATPMPVETTEVASLTDASPVDSQPTDVEVEAAETGSEDAGPETSGVGTEVSKPLERAIDALTSNVQPLLLKLPTSLRQRLGLAESETELEGGAQQPVDVVGSEEIAEEDAGVEVDTPANVSPEVIADGFAEQSEELSAVQEEKAPLDSDAETEPETDVDGSVAELLDAEVEEPVSEEPVVEDSLDDEPVETPVAVDSTAHVSQEEVSQDGYADIEEESVETESTPEPRFEEVTENRGDSPETIGESQPVVESPDEEPVVEDTENDEVGEEPETVEPAAQMSDGDSEDDEASVEVDSPSDAEPNSSDSDDNEPSTTETDLDDTHPLTGMVATAASLSEVAEIASSQQPEPSEEVGVTAVQSASNTAPVTPPASGSPSPTTSTPPVVSASLPRMPRSNVKSDSTAPQPKMGTPLNSSVSLPTSTGRVPKAGGSFEPKVKGS